MTCVGEHAGADSRMLPSVAVGSWFPQALAQAGVQSRPDIFSVPDTHAGAQSRMGVLRSCVLGTHPPCQAGTTVSRPDSNMWADTHAAAESRMRSASAPSTSSATGVRGESDTDYR